METVLWFSSYDDGDGPMGLRSNDGKRRKAFGARLPTRRRSLSLSAFLLLVLVLVRFLLLFACLLFLTLVLILFPAFVSHCVTPFHFPFTVSP